MSVAALPTDLSRRQPTAEELAARAARQAKRIRNLRRAIKGLQHAYLEKDRLMLMQDARIHELDCRCEAYKRAARGLADATRARVRADFVVTVLIMALGIAMAIVAGLL